MSLYELDGVRVETPGEARYWVAPNAFLIGKVILEEDASVWFGSVLRGDNEAVRVGARSNVQENCVLHTDPGLVCSIGDGVTIGHLAIVHGAEIGDNVVIGMHAVVMNRAKVGANSIIGVGAVVTEGVDIPPGSLVMGLPGRVKRPLTEAEIEGIRLSALHYVHNARQFKRAGGE